MDQKKLTAEERYAAGADHHDALSPARAADLMTIIAKVSAERGEARPPRLDWLKKLADGEEPKA